jgi:hypothetical protein
VVLEKKIKGKNNWLKSLAAFNHAVTLFMDPKVAPGNACKRRRHPTEGMHRHRTVTDASLDSLR